MLAHSSNALQNGVEFDALDGFLHMMQVSVQAARLGDPTDLQQQSPEVSVHLAALMRQTMAAACLSAAAAELDDEMTWLRRFNSLLCEAKYPPLLQACTAKGLAAVQLIGVSTPVRGSAVRARIQVELEEYLKTHDLMCWTMSLKPLVPAACRNMTRGFCDLHFECCRAGRCRSSSIVCAECHSCNSSSGRSGCCHSSHGGE